MVTGTVVLLILGLLVLIWAEIINIDIPKESLLIEESSELVPTES